MDPYSMGRELMDARLSEQSRELEAARLVREAREFRRRSDSGQAKVVSRLVDRLLCQLDYWRIMLAERLARYDLAQSMLRVEQTRLLSAGRCN